ncbi:hypothetical protein H6G36_26315 [Anabaena minutissima FACHB-250]|nr:hypothetical protein [Anabaena minutissima FACHB-250]
MLSVTLRSNKSRNGDRISRVYSSELEESVQRFLESLGKLKRFYLTALEDKVLGLIEQESEVVD